MKYIKKFESFRENLTTQPKRSPDTQPNQPEVHPGVRPGTRPNRPSPIRRDKPAVTPKPKAEEKLKKATEKDVIEKFAKLTNQSI